MRFDLDRLAADVEAALLARGGRERGDEIIFQCITPEHDDEHPSCRYHRKKCCYICDSCSASGGLLTGQRPMVPLLRLDQTDYELNKGNGAGQITSWEIRDAANNVRAVHHRRDLPDGTKNLWWSSNGKPGLDGTRTDSLPLYGTHLLTEREPGDDTPVIVVEGEKAADELFGINVPALGTVTGASSAPATAVLEVLRGREVVLWPDADDAGRQHMAKIASRLDGIAASVRMFQPDGLPDGGDAVEWLEAHSAADLLEAIEAEATVAELANVAPTDDTALLSVDDFFAYMPMHRYIYAPTGDMWPPPSVNSRIAPISVGDDKTISASKWIDQNRPVEQMTWAPGDPMLIEDRLIAEGGCIERPGVHVFNLYRPPRIEPGDANEARPWFDLVLRVYPDDTEHIVRWLAHRVQRPDEKINHALVLGGMQGIGKDTILEPAKRAVGPWNFTEVSPTQMMGRFNSFVKSVILRVSEARDLGDINRFTFYDHLKVYTAAPPDVLRVDEKHLREYAVPNVCGVVITSNNKSDGIYLPADDRRHYVAWSTLTKDDFTDHYWTDLWGWYEQGRGAEHVAAFLLDYDLSAFNSKAPPPKTPAFHDIVDANRAPEDAELADAFDMLGNPDATTLGDVAAVATKDFGDWLTDRRNFRQIPHRMESVGYAPVRNDAAKDGKWKIAGRRQVIYVKQELPARDRITVARALIEAKR